jgi:hypothetical protein
MWHFLENNIQARFLQRILPYGQIKTNTIWMKMQKFCMDKAALGSHKINKINEISIVAHLYNFVLNN